MHISSINWPAGTRPYQNNTVFAFRNLTFTYTVSAITISVIVAADNAISPLQSLAKQVKVVVVLVYVRKKKKHFTGTKRKLRRKRIAIKRERLGLTQLAGVGVYLGRWPEGSAGWPAGPLEQPFPFTSTALRHH